VEPYLVDVPVVLFVFIRPDTLAKVFEVLRKAKPSKLFLVSDGPRKSVPSDKKKIEESRKIVENITWDCEVHRLYFEENQGMYPMFKLAMDYVFQKVDRCIFLEDDVVTSVSFFKFCSELLEKYKNDLRVNMICGMNQTESYENPSSDYFFTKGASIWGFAFWKRTYELFYDLDYGNDHYALNLLINNSKGYSNFQKSLIEYLKNTNFNGHPAGAEFYLGFTLISQHQLNIVPKKNMVCNIGYGEGNTHFGNNIKLLPKAIQKLFNMKIYELDLPLKHPKYVLEDTIYEKKIKQILGRNLFRRVFRKIEVISRKLFFKTKFFLRKIFKK